MEFCISEIAKVIQAGAWYSSGWEVGSSLDGTVLTSCAMRTQTGGWEGEDQTALQPLA